MKNFWVSAKKHICNLDFWSGIILGITLGVVGVFLIVDFVLRMMMPF